PCDINIAKDPLKGKYSGRGGGTNPKFDIVNNARGASSAMSLSVDDPLTGMILTLVGSDARWRSQTDLQANPIQRSASLNATVQVERSVGGPEGLGVASASDPWLFTPAESTMLDLSITLLDVDLVTVTEDPREFGAAQ